MSDLNKQEYQYTGTIKSIGPVQQISDKFRKQEFVLRDESSEYPQDLLFEFQQASCDKLVNYRVGSLVNISFNLRGRQWTNPQGEVKTFNTLQAWRIAGYAVDKGAQPVVENAAGPVDSPDDTLPF